ncbi:MAG: D-alanyl-D-alanine carboxypeptidase family protein [Candidatus Rokuibacteriota bacterium]
MSRVRSVLILLAGLAVLVPLPAVAQTRRPLVLSAESVLLVDPSGRTLFAKNPQADHAPASLVKLMTLYLALESIEAGSVGSDDLVTISQHAASTDRYRMGLHEGDRVPLHTVMEGVGIASANDAATALAEHVAGSEAAFVERMNAKAAAMGLTGTRFANPHGLPHPNQRSNARDLARLTARLLEDYPDARAALGGETFVYRGRVYARNISLFRDPGGVQALKTGFTREAGYNLSVSAWRGGRQFLMIVLGAQTRARSFMDAKKLLRFAFIEAGLDLPPSVGRDTPKRPIRTRRANSVRR